MKGDTPRDNTDKREVGENIRLLRVGRGLTQEELVNEMNGMLGKSYTPNMISLYENGRDHMHMGALFDFASFFGVSPTELIPARFLKGDDAILSQFRKLSPENRTTLIKMLKFLLTESDASD